MVDGRWVSMNDWDDWVGKQKETACTLPHPHTQPPMIRTPLPKYDSAPALATHVHPEKIATPPPTKVKIPAPVHCVFLGQVSG
jgi:hypothetical protein